MISSGLNELEAIAAVARLGGFRAAAVELGLSASAVSHAVAALEARMGVRLFNRTTRSVAPTLAGEEFLREITPALARIRAAIAGAGGRRDTPAGVLRINSAVGPAHQLLAPFVMTYLDRCPAMSVEIVTEGRLIDIVQGGFDAGIRLRESTPQDMIAIPFGGPLQSMVVGSPAYLAEHGAPQTPWDLARHRCVRARNPSGTRAPWEFCRQGETLSINVEGQLTLDEPTLMARVALEGGGLAYLSEWYVGEHLRTGRLVRVLEAWTQPYPGLCLYYPGRRLVPPGLRQFVDVLREAGGGRSKARP